jgi:SAM-dependent methyltransferase
MIEPNKDEVARIANGVEPVQLLQLDAARFLVAKRRLSERRAELQVSDDQDGLWNDALDINIPELEKLNVVQRVKRLTFPLGAIDRVFGREQKLKVLCVGPRTEMELMILWGLGFRDVRGLDLFSYSPYVDVGNIMHAPYPDNTFDIVIVGWVLVYLSDPIGACKEISRIAKSNGIIAIGSTYYPPARQLTEGNGRGPEHYPLADDLLKRFPLGRCFVRHETPNPNLEGRTIVIFEQDKK